MTVVEERFASVFGALQRLQQVESDVTTLKGGGGGGTSDGMLERVARLEKNYDQVAKDLGDVRTDVATLKENVRHLPTKPWIFTTLASMLTVMLAVMSFIVAVLIRFLPHAG